MSKFEKLLKLLTNVTKGAEELKAFLKELLEDVPEAITPEQQKELDKALHLFKLAMKEVKL